MALWIKANGECEKVQPKNGVFFELEELQEYVGGYIEIVPLDTRNVLVVNEDGRSLCLPFNEKATAYYFESDTVSWSDIFCDAIACDKTEIV